MQSKKFETVAKFTNGALGYRVSASDKLAWNTARQWATVGIEDRYKPNEDGSNKGHGHIIPASAIVEILVREHDPAFWIEKKEPLIETPPEPRIVIP